MSKGFTYNDNIHNKNPPENLNLFPFFIYSFVMMRAYPLHANQKPTIIEFNTQEGTHIDLLPKSLDFLRSDIKFGNWALGQYSGIGPTDFFLYNGLTQHHPLIISPRDEVIVNHSYDNIHMKDAYDKLPSPMNIIISYGQEAPSSGTAIGLQNSIDIYNESIPTHGHNEFSSYYAFVRANNHGIHPPS